MDVSAGCDAGSVQGVFHETAPVGSSDVEDVRTWTRGARLFSALWGRIGAVVAHRVFFVFIVGAFALQASLIAVSSARTMYDESYHVSAIEMYSRYWLPFVDQTVADGPLGDAERYGSYLYHYLMSFPWRVAEAVGLSEWHRVVLLRLITVGIVCVALVAWRWLFRELGASRALANFVTAAVSLMPLIVFLAAFVNYDNLLFLAVPLFLATALRLYRMPVLGPREWLLFLLVTGLACVTKYSFLPMVPAVAIILLVKQVHAARSEGLSASWRRLRDFLWPAVIGRRVQHGLLLALVVLAIALVCERYVGNLIIYGTPSPDCIAVHDYSICEMHAPWRRNQALDESFPDVALSMGGALAYLSFLWTPLMLKNFTWYGVASNGDIMQSHGPNVTGTIVALAAVFLLTVVLLSWPVLRRISGFWILVVPAASYVLALFYLNYSEYSAFGVPVAVQGRYLLILLPVLLCLAAIGVSRMLGGLAPALRGGVGVFLVGVSLLIATQGGGVSSYLWSVDEQWLAYPNGRAGSLVIDMSGMARSVILDDSKVMDYRPVPTSLG